MKLLLVAATEKEIWPFLNSHHEQDGIVAGRHLINVLVTGVGMVPTAFALGKHLAGSSYDLAINVGIAGSFDPDLPLGEVCYIARDAFAELGAEDGEEFLPVENLGLGSSVFLPDPHPGFTTGMLREVNAITVNTVHGNELSIANTRERFNPQLESMEGAAFFYACGQAGVRCIQLRAISNYVERRNRERWNIPLAVQNLNDTIFKLLKS
jgi:futalosine hydrolase